MKWEIFAVDFTNIIYFVSINKLFGLVVSEEKIFKVSVNNKKILMGAMFIWPIKMKWHIFVEDFKIIISVNFESGVQLSFYRTYIWLFSLETYCFLNYFSF